jgi:hypothetical protein
LKPQNLNDAFGFAKIQDEFGMSTRRTYRSSGFHNTSAFQQSGNHSQGSQHQKHVYTSATIIELGVQGELGFPTRGSKQNLHVHKNFTAQMEERRRKCICHCCDDKFSPTHQCLKRKVLLMEGSELVHGDQLVTPETYWGDSRLELQIQEEEGEVQLPEISMHAITSSPNLETMRLVGAIQSHGITNFG